MSITLTSEQEAIVTGPREENSLIIAGAGSGKTFTMTQRIIWLLTHPDKNGQKVDPGTILGLTFTNKAAEELRTRVHTAVDELEEKGSGEPQFTRIPSTQRPHIYTYDSFFQRLVRQYGLLIGVDPNSTPLSYAGVHQLIDEVIDENIDDIMALNYSTDRFWEGFKPESRNTFVTNMNKLNDEILGYMISPECLTFEAAVERVRQWNNALIEQCEKLCDEVITTDPTLWAAVVGALFKDTKPTVGRGTSQKEESRRAQLRKTAQRLDLYNVRQIYKAAKIRDLLLDLCLQLQRKKHEGHLAQYSDFPVYSLQLLQRFPSIAQQYRRRFRYVFLDEYQDTSSTQASLIAQLFHRAENTEENDEKIGQDRNSVVTAVGDPYQSIYAWRGASPSAFILFKEDFDVVEKSMHTLSRTHRNKPLILEFANAVTSRLRDMDTIHRKVSYPDDSLGPSVSVKKLEPMLMENTEEARRKAQVGNPDDATFTVLNCLYASQEAKAVAKWARYQVLKYKNDPRHRDEHGKGPIVALLDRGGKNLGLYQQALEEQGLTCQSLGWSAVAEKPEIRDIMAVVASLADTSDSSHLMRLLATPRFALNAEQLNSLATQAKKVNENQQYNALVASAIASGDEDDKARRELLRQYRDTLPMAMSLVDMLISDDSEQLLTATFDDQHKAVEKNGESATEQANAQDGEHASESVAEPNPEQQPEEHSSGASESNDNLSQPLDETTRAACREVSRILQETARHKSEGVIACLKAAASALGMTSDLSLAHALQTGDTSLHSRAEIATNIDSLIELARTYMKEIPANVRPSLSGFVTWFDSLPDREQDATEVEQDPNVDVILMTMHRSKGLEWPAVAIVDVTEGNHTAAKLKVAKLSPLADAAQDPLCPHTLSWMGYPGSVPVPMRSDAYTLPAFPHNVSFDSTGLGVDPIADLRKFTTVESLAHEVFNPDSHLVDNPLLEKGVDYPDFLTLEEREGEREFADENRLFYVALTRSQGDVLFASHIYTDEEDIEQAYLKDEDRKAEFNSCGINKAGVFYQQVAQHALALAGYNDFSGVKVPQPEESSSKRRKSSNEDDPPLAVTYIADQIQAQQAVLPSAPITVQTSLEDSERVDVDGLSVGVDAQAQAALFGDDLEYQSVLADRVEKSSSAAAQAFGHGAPVFWPTHVDKTTMSILRRAQKLLDGLANATNAETLTEELNEQEKAQAGPLTRRAQALVELTRRNHELDELAQQDEAQTLKKLGEINKTRSLTATRLQHIIMPQKQQDVHELLAQQLRPMPHIPTAASTLGTLFHAWVADQLDPLSGQDWQKIKKLESIAKSSSERAATVQRWQKAYLNSPWASRRVFAVEKEYDISLAGRRVPARLDAIFAGALRDQAGEETANRYTIIDWKTGRPPYNEEDKRRKLLQLQIYRLAFAQAQNVALDDVDAALFYVSAGSAGKLIPVGHKLSEQEIISMIYGSHRLLAFLQEDDWEEQADENEADENEADEGEAGENKPDENE